MGSVFLWTASRTFLKVLVKFVVYLLNFCCLCTFDIFKDRREQRRLKTKDGKKMYTQDLLNIVGNPNYNPIADPRYDLDKYSKVCAGIMFICEGEVLLLQRNSNNNDLCFDIPGGTLDYEDFFTAQEKQDKETKNKSKKDNKQQSDHSQSNSIANHDDDSVPQKNPISRKKGPIYPTIPLYDSFYFADLFSAQFQQLNIQSWQHKGLNKRQQLERLHEQSIRHMNHGYGFASACWQGAVRECREEIGTFPSTITPLAVFNIYRGWSAADSSSSDESSSDGDESDDFDIESQALINAQKCDSNANGKTSSNRQKNINVSLLGTGKVISENFRRYTMYIVSITPEQRNELQQSIRLSEEHICYGFFPLCLLIPMQSTTVSTFKHFRLHPWFVSFIEQYTLQFEKLANKVFWVGFNRHFDEVPQIGDHSGKKYKQDKGKKEKKGGKRQKKPQEPHTVSSGTESDGFSNHDSPYQTATKIPTNKDEEQILSDDVLLDITTLQDHLHTTTDSANIQSSSKLQSIENDKHIPDNRSDDEHDDEDAEADADDKKKKKGDKKKNGEKKGEKKGKKDKKGKQDEEPSHTIPTEPPNSTIPETIPSTTAVVQAENIAQPPESQQLNAELPEVGFDSRDVFISTFLPLVKKHMNPSVYI